VNRRRFKIEVLVELFCSLIDRMDQDRACPYDVGGASDSQESVLQKRFAESSPSFTSINGKPCKQDHRDGMSGKDDLTLARKRLKELER
jgi:hypothetical protein